MRSGGTPGPPRPGAEVGADVEQVVLHRGQHRDHVVLEALGGDSQSDGGVRLVHVGVRRQSARSVLRVVLMSPSQVPPSPVRV